MAKAKKTSASKKPSASAKPPAAKPIAPLIDTTLAASTAARMVAARGNLSTANSTPAAGEQKHETSAFKQLKQGLAKPPSTLVGSLAPLAGHKKSNLPDSFGKQVGHNQTFGADVNRSGVPRRTGG